MIARLHDEGYLVDSALNVYQMPYHKAPPVLSPAELAQIRAVKNMTERKAYDFGLHELLIMMGYESAPPSLPMPVAFNEACPCEQCNYTYNRAQQKMLRYTLPLDRKYSSVVFLNFITTLRVGVIVFYLFFEDNHREAELPVA